MLGSFTLPLREESEGSPKKADAMAVLHLQWGGDRGSGYASEALNLENIDQNAGGFPWA